jgi:hypothetical protein
MILDSQRPIQAAPPLENESSTTTLLNDQQLAHSEQKVQVEESKMLHAVLDQPLIDNPV